MTRPGDPFHVIFRIGDAFSPGDPLSEWVVTIALAANDLATANEYLAEPDPLAQRHTYLFRTAMSHFHEVIENLKLRARDPVVVEFIASMGERADGYHAALDTHRRFSTPLAKLRNNAAFHYPMSTSARSPITRALKDAEHSNGVVSVGERPITGRFVFADEVMAALFTKCCADDAEFEALFREVSEAVFEFYEFAHLAVSEFVSRSGANIQQVEMAEPSNVYGGWLPVALPVLDPHVSSRDID